MEMKINLETKYLGFSNRKNRTSLRIGANTTDPSKTFTRVKDTVLAPRTFMDRANAGVLPGQRVIGKAVPVAMAAYGGAKSLSHNANQLEADSSAAGKIRSTVSQKLAAQEDEMGQMDSKLERLRALKIATRHTADSLPAAATTSQRFARGVADSFSDAKERATSGRWVLPAIARLGAVGVGMAAQYAIGARAAGKQRAGAEQVWQRIQKDNPEIAQAPDAREYFELLMTSSPTIASNYIAARSALVRMSRSGGVIPAEHISELGKAEQSLRGNAASRPSVTGLVLDRFSKSNPSVSRLFDPIERKPGSSSKVRQESRNRSVDVEGGPGYDDILSDFASELSSGERSRSFKQELADARGPQGGALRSVDTLNGAINPSGFAGGREGEPRLRSYAPNQSAPSATVTVRRRKKQAELNTYDELDLFIKTAGEEGFDDDDAMIDHLLGGSDELMSKRASLGEAVGDGELDDETFARLLAGEGL